MQLTVELYEKDVDAFVAYHNSRLPKVLEERKRQRKERVRARVINIASTSLGSAIPCLFHGNWHSFWMGALIGSGIGEAHRFYKDKKCIQQGKQQEASAIAPYVTANTGNWQIRVDYSGVVVSRRGDTWRFHRDKVGRVVTIPGYTFVYLTEEWAFTIPHHAVRPAEYKAFMQALAELFESPLPMPPLTFTPLEEAAKQTVGVRTG